MSSNSPQPSASSLPDSPENPAAPPPNSPSLKSVSSSTMPHNIALPPSPPSPPSNPPSPPPNSTPLSTLQPNAVQTPSSSKPVQTPPTISSGAINRLSSGIWAMLRYLDKPLRKLGWCIGLGSLIVAAYWAPLMWKMAVWTANNDFGNSCQEDQVSEKCFLLSM